MSRKITLKDIAQKAGVSPAAVSIILNDKPSRISKVKKHEVKQIAKDLNYIPNYLAQSLSLQQTHTIGLVVPDLTNPFFATLSKEIEKRLTNLGYFTFIMNSDEKISQDKEIVQKMLQRRIDGLILCASNDNYARLDETIRWLETIEIPLILVDRVFHSSHLSSIAFNNHQGGYLVGEYMSQQIINPQKTVVCLTGDLLTYTSKERLKGFKEGLSAAYPMIEPVILSGDYSIDSGYRMGQQLLTTLPMDQLAGVFCFNDLIAYGLIKVIEEHHLNWQDFGIIGYDHLKIGSILGYSFPSIAQNIAYLAKEACAILMNQMKQRQPVQVQLNVHLVNKKSEP